LHDSFKYSPPINIASDRKIPTNAYAIKIDFTEGKNYKLMKHNQIKNDGGIYYNSF